MSAKKLSGASFFLENVHRYRRRPNAYGWDRTTRDCASWKNLPSRSTKTTPKNSAYLGAPDPVPERG